MDNNVNQNNQMENGFNPNVVTPTTPMTPTPNQNYVQYQTPTQTNNTNLGGSTNPPKKTGFLVIFGVIFLIAIVLVVTLFIENNNSEESSGLINENTKTLIVYFSKEGQNYGKNLNVEVTIPVGNTEVMSKRIASFIDADLYEIEPLEAYPEDLKELYAKTKVEYNKDVYPEIKNKVSNLDSYDVIFIGYPIWHASYPQIIKTFVRDNKDILKNKIIVPFNTHAGSGSAGTYKKLFNLIECSEEKGLNGLAINGTEVSTSDDNIKNWLEGLGYKLK